MNRTMLVTALVLASGLAGASSLEGNPDLYGTVLLRAGNADTTTPIPVQRGVGDVDQGFRTERSEGAWPDNIGYGTNDGYGSPLRDVTRGLDW